MDAKTKASKIRQIANNLYGIRLPALEATAIGTVLTAANDLMALAREVEGEEREADNQSE